MFSRCEAGVGGVSTLLFSFTRLAPPPTHDPEISPAGFSFLLLREERPGATPQQCSFGLVLTAKGCHCRYSLACREGVFSALGGGPSPSKGACKKVSSKILRLRKRKRIGQQGPHHPRLHQLLGKMASLNDYPEILGAVLPCYWIYGGVGKPSSNAVPRTPCAKGG